jgi:hypothetical protein
MEVTIGTIIVFAVIFFATYIFSKVIIEILITTKYLKKGKPKMRLQLIISLLLFLISLLFINKS